MKAKTIISFVHEGDRIPFDGKVVEGLALVDESAQTGVSTPVLLDHAGDHNNALAGTVVVEGRLKIESPLDARMRDENPNDRTARASQGGMSARAKAAIILLLLALVAAVFYSSAWARHNVLSHNTDSDCHVSRTAIS